MTSEVSMNQKELKTTDFITQNYTLFRSIGDSENL